MYPPQTIVQFAWGGQSQGQIARMCGGRGRSPASRQPRCRWVRAAGWRCTRPPADVTHAERASGFLARTQSVSRADLPGWRRCSSGPVVSTSPSTGGGRCRACSLPTSTPHAETWIWALVGWATLSSSPSRRRTGSDSSGRCWTAAPWGWIPVHVRGSRLGSALGSPWLSVDGRRFPAWPRRDGGCVSNWHHARHCGPGIVFTGQTSTPGLARRAGRSGDRPGGRRAHGPPRLDRCLCRGEDPRIDVRRRAMGRLPVSVVGEPRVHLRSCVAP